MHIIRVIFLDRKRLRICGGLAVFQFLKLRFQIFITAQFIGIGRRQNLRFQRRLPPLGFIKLCPFFRRHRIKHRLFKRIDPLMQIAFAGGDRFQFQLVRLLLIIRHDIGQNLRAIGLVRRDIVEERQQAVIVLLRDRIDLVIVAAGSSSIVMPRNPWPTVVTMSSSSSKRACSRSAGSSSQMPRR